MTEPALFFYIRTTEFTMHATDISFWINVATQNSQQIRWTHGLAVLRWIPHSPNVSAIHNPLSSDVGCTQLYDSPPQWNLSQVDTANLPKWISFVWSPLDTIHCVPKKVSPLNILQQPPQTCTDLNEILHTHTRWHLFLSPTSNFIRIPYSVYEMFNSFKVLGHIQTCIWPSWCHCHSLSLASVKSRFVLPFWYRLTWVVPEKGH